MIMFERIKNLCKDRKISVNDLENSLGYSKNTLYRLKTQTPGADKLEAIADYFKVSTDFLLGRTDKRYLDLNDNDKSYLDNKLQQIIGGLKEEEKEFLIAALDNTLQLAKSLAKK